MKRNGSIVTFGESLMRLSPPGHLRLRQAHSFELVFGGAEANVAISLASFGIPVQYVTRLPANALGGACRQWLRMHGVGTEFIETGGARLGLYFLEVGSGQRPSQVIYDRAGSSFATLDEGVIRWQPVFSQATWFHWSGISPAVSPGAARATAQAVSAAHAAGLTVSCDLNYRHALWKWGVSAAEFMPALVEQCDVLSANAAQLMLGLPSVPKGATVDEALQACSQLATHYPNLKQIAMTCREATASAEKQYTAVLWQAGRHYVSKTFKLNHIVDRVGAGDAFMAGLIYGLLNFGDDPQRIINFAAASAAIKHTIAGDANLTGIDEIEQLLSPGNGFDIVR